MKSLPFLAFLLALAPAGTAIAADAQQPSTLDIAIRPVGTDGIDRLEIREIFHDGDADGLQLSFPIVYPGAPGAADRLTGLRLEDADGALPFAVKDDAALPGGFPYFRHFTASRAINYPLTVSYAIDTVGGGGPNGPAFAMRRVGGGVAGSGATFLLLPDKPVKGTISVQWDLSALPAGSIASSSYGDGDYRFTADSDALTQSWFLIGPAGHLPMKDGFGAAWLGKPTFDVQAEMIRTRGVYHYLGGFFPHLKPTPDYRVYLQFRSEAPFGGGTALDRSFMLSQSDKAENDTERRMETIFHEMIHQWVGFIEGPQGVTSWFSEGLTSYYTSKLTVRSGLFGMDFFERAINRLEQEYRTSKARNWSADKIVEVGFGDEEVRHTPYRRSELYFDDLDARIRAKSGGKRSLDTLMFRIFKEREQGVPFTQAKWIEEITRELGPQEAERFQRLIIEGVDTLEPRPDTYGPCFRAEKTVFDHGGQPVPGLRWVRVPGKSDAYCKGRI